MANTPSKEITYEWGRTTPDELAKQADSLDTKILTLFAFSGVLIGAIASLAHDIRLDCSLIAFVAAGLAFIGVSGWGLISLWPKYFYVAVNPKTLRLEYWPLKQEEMRDFYWSHIEENFESNLGKVNAKAQAVKGMLVGLSLEVVALVTWVFLLALL